jgi:hypothetical protein
MLLAAAFILFTFAAAYPQAEPAFRVDLKVSGDVDAASVIETCIKSELASLRNVEITDAKPDYTINVIVMDLVSKEKVPMGLALTWLALYHPKGFFESCSLVEDFRLLTFEKEEMQSDCRKLVGRFDAKSLQPHRKIFEKAGPK